MNDASEEPNHCPNCGAEQTYPGPYCHNCGRLVGKAGRAPKNIGCAVATIVFLVIVLALASPCAVQTGPYADPTRQMAWTVIGVCLVLIFILIAVIIDRRR